MQEGRLLKRRYRLCNQVESEAASETWVAHDEVLEREVFVKLLRSSVAVSSTAQERFEREMGNAAKFSHPNIMATYDTISDFAATGVVREKVKGKQLSHFLRARGALSPAEIVAIAARVTDALLSAKAQGVFHQNLRPECVWLCIDRVVKVTDFGSVWNLDISGEMRPSEYTDPGLPTDAEVDEQAEVFALGKLLSTCMDAARRDAALLGLSDESVRLPESFLIFLSAALAEDRTLRPSLEQSREALMDALAHFETRATLTAEGAGAPKENAPREPGAASIPVLNTAAMSTREWQLSRSRLRRWLIGVGLAALAGGILVSLLTAPERVRSGSNGAASEGTSEIGAGEPVADASSGNREANPSPPGATTASTITFADNDAASAAGGESLISIAYSTTFAPNVNASEIGGEAAAAIDGNRNTAWTTKGILAGSATAGGVGLVIKLRREARLRELVVHTPSRDWKAEVYAARAAFGDLPDWGPVVDTHYVDMDRVSFRMGGIEANSILLWIPEPLAARTDEIHIAEITISLVDN